MKLRQCHVTNFGNLKNFSYQFNNGLNILNHENGWGKTTMATFLKCMLYGVSNYKGNNISENERKKFLPWQGGQFGGSLDFEVNNKIYRVERYFGKNNSEDSFKLYDLQTGKISNDYSANLGIELFDLDEAAFMRTIYIPQKDLETPVNESIANKLNHLVQGTTEKNNAEVALKLLDERRRQLSNSHKTGEIEVIKKQISELNVRINQLQQTPTQISALQEKINYAAKELQNLRKTQATTQQQHLDKIMLQTLEAQVNHAQMELSQKCQMLNGHTTNLDEVDKYIKLRQESRFQTAVRSQTINPVKKLCISLTVVAALIMVIGTMLTLLIPIVGWLTLITAAVLLLVGTVLFFANNHHPQNTYKQQAQESDSDIKAYLDNFIFSTYYDNDDDKLTYLRQCLLEKNYLEERLEKCQITLETFQQDHQVNLDDEASNQPSNSNAIYEKLQTTYLQDINELRYLEQDLQELETLINDKNNLTEQLSSLEQEFTAILNAKKYLEIANDHLNSQLLQPMQQGLRKYLKLIAEKDFTNLTLDTNFNLLLDEAGQHHTLDYYSKGYQNTFEICLRLALIDALFNKEKPFVILDDPFVNLDEVKIKNAKAFLKQLSQECQIIYFTCHTSRC